MQSRKAALASLGVMAALSVMAALGCGSSTGPPAAVFAEARHLDTLAQSAASDGAFDRYRLLTYPVAVLAEGISPDSVSLAVDAGSAPYQVGALELVGQTAGSKPTPSDSVFVLFAWTGSDVSQLVYVVTDVSGDVIDVAQLADTTSSGQLTAGTVSASRTTLDGGCHTLQLATAASLLRATCRQATFTAAFDLTFAPDSSFPNQHFVLTSQAVRGARLLLPATTGGQDLVHQFLLHPRP